MTRRPPRSTLFPYPALSRSAGGRELRPAEAAKAVQDPHLEGLAQPPLGALAVEGGVGLRRQGGPPGLRQVAQGRQAEDRKSTRLNSSHANISYAVFCLKKKQ